ncbi:MAG: hypothetical protein ILA17_07415 [Ruminococcus sp.]|nr:hypothetical protein [Ruminiclostridium sp.]MBP1537681.1 hypothetical protein [Ruminococcus sp.]
MEYVFGTRENIEILKTKGDRHTDLRGFHVVERSYPDQVITDSFHIVRKLDSKEDEAENCYDWYEIDNHYRTVDKSGPVAEALAQSRAEIEDAMIETDIATNERITQIEDALIELDEQVNGGNENG